MPAPQRNRSLLALATTALLLLSMPPLGSFALPPLSSPEQTPAGEPYVTVSTRTPAVPPDGTLDLKITVEIDRETSYLESRVQLRGSSDQLIYQKTQIQHDVATGTAVFEYDRALEDLALEPGAYPLEMRVRSDSGEVREWLIEDELLVYDDEAEPAEMVILTRFGCSLGSDPEGRFVLDPSSASRTRNELDALAAYAVGHAESSTGLIISPAVLEEWERVAEGYQYVGSEGLVSVDSDSEVSQDHATTLSLLRTALDTGRLELLDVPYSDPDILGLSQTNRLDDLEPQFERGLSAYLASLDIAPLPVAATAEGLLPLGGLAVLEGRETFGAVVTTASIAIDGELSSGPALAAGSDVALLVVDGQASAALASADTRSLMRALFDRHLEEDSGGPVIVEVPLGAGASLTVEELEECMDDIHSAPWIRTVSTQQAVGAAQGSAILRSELDDTSDAPNGYWNEIAESRLHAQALLAAAGTNDSRAQAASDSSMLSQSRCWAGPDDSWVFADRGRAFAAAATRLSDETLDVVSIAAKDITLSGARGDVPVSIVNGGEDELTVTLKTLSDDLTVGGTETEIVTLHPSENLYSIPVDLKSALSGRLRVEVWSDELLIDEQDVTVSASYLDRLAIIGGVAIVLVGMLVFIRRRVLRASADTMEKKS